MVTHLNSYFLTNSLHQVLVTKLTERGIRQHVFVPVEKGPEVPLALELEGASLSLNPCFTNWQRRLWPVKMFNLWINYKTDRKHHPPTLHHAHSLIVNGLVAYHAKRRFGTPYIVTVRNTDCGVFLAKSRFFRWMAAKVLDDAEAVITLSPVWWNHHIPQYFSEEQIEKWSRKHHLIPNGCDDYWLTNASEGYLLEDQLEILFVGRLTPNKNVGGLFDAIGHLQHRGLQCHVTIVGSGPHEEELRRRARKLPVSFRGWVDDRRSLLELYRSAHVLAVPSLTESFGVVYAEALSQGLPVVYSERQGFDGFFEDGIVGHAVNPKDPADIAYAIERIGSKHSQFSKRAREHADAFQWDPSVGRLVRLYERVTGEEGA